MVIEKAYSLNGFTTAIRIVDFPSSREAYKRLVLKELIESADQVTIITNLKEEKKSAVLGQNEKASSRKITTVILPQVRIIALDGNRQQGGDEFVLALPPQQAQMLLAAQAQGIELAPALRRPHDESNLNRTTIGLVDMKTFYDLTKGVERTNIPVVPTKK